MIQGFSFSKKRSQYIGNVFGVFEELLVKKKDFWARMSNILVSLIRTANSNLWVIKAKHLRYKTLKMNEVMFLGRYYGILVVERCKIRRLLYGK